MASSMPLSSSSGDLLDSAANIQRLLDENEQLIKCIAEDHAAGRVEDQHRKAQLLQRNLISLALAADQDLFSELLGQSVCQQEPAAAAASCTQVPSAAQQAVMQQHYQMQQLQLQQQLQQQHQQQQQQVAAAHCAASSSQQTTMQQMQLLQLQPGMHPGMHPQQLQQAICVQQYGGFQQQNPGFDGYTGGHPSAQSGYHGQQQLQQLQMQQQQMQQQQQQQQLQAYPGYGYPEPNQQYYQQHHQQK